MTTHVNFELSTPDGETSPLIDTTFSEKFDADKCRVLLANHNTLLQMTWTDSAWGDTCGHENEYEQLYAYYSSLNKRTKQPTVKVNYKHCKDYSFGRIYPERSLSLGSLRKEVRHTLAGEYYYDVDIANAHPVLLYQIAKKESEQCGCPFETIEYYVKNREQCLADVMNADNRITRDDAKNLFIVLTYGGGVERWWGKCGNEEEVPSLPAFVSEFKAELKTLSKLVCQRLPEVHQLMKTLKKTNPQRSTLSLLLQDKERAVLEHMLTFFLDQKVLKKERNGNVNAVLCFDGIMIPKSQVPKDKIPYILESLALYIKNATGFTLTFTEKAMEKAIDLTGRDDVNDKACKQAYAVYLDKKDTSRRVKELQEQGKQIDEQLLHNVIHPLQASRKLLSIYRHFLTTTSGTASTLWVYDDKTFMWTHNPSSIHSLIIDKAEHYLYLPADMIDGKYVGIRTDDSFAFTPRRRKEMLENLMAVSIDNSTLKEIESSSLGKLLFKNGYLDGHTFHPLKDCKPNPTLAFFTRVEADLTFPKCDADRAEMEMVKQKLFFAPLGEELGQYLITFLARALMGHTQMKLFPFLVGFSNTGKTTLYKLIKQAFNGVVGDFNIDCIVYNKNGGGDPAQKQRWALLNRYNRLMFASESGADTVDSRMYKSLSSAGDGLTARQHCGNEETFMPHFTCVGLTNQMVSFAPADDAVSNRCRAVFYKRAFVPAEEVVNEEYHIARDAEFETYMETPRCLEVLRWVMIDAFVSFLETPQMTFPVSAENNDFVSSSKVNDIDAFLEDFDITGECGYSGDKITVKEFNEWYKASGLKGSKSTFFESIKRHAVIHGLTVEKARLNSARVIRGIRFKPTENEITDA